MIHCFRPAHREDRLYLFGTEIVIPYRDRYGKQ